MVGIGMALLFKVSSDGSNYSGQIYMQVKAISSLMQGIISHLLVLQFAKYFFFFSLARYL